MAEAVAAAVAVAAATAAATALAERAIAGGAALYDWLKEKIIHSKKEKTFDYLEKAVKLLGDKRDEYESIVIKNSVMVSKIYGDWLHKVKEIEDEFKELVTRNEKESKASSFHFRPNKKMKKMGEEVIDLLVQGNQFQEFLVDKPERVMKMTEPPDIKGIETRKKELNEIVNLLKNDKVEGIGILGRLGIGKTAVMQNLNNHKQVATMFDIVIWLKVSTEENNKNLCRKDLQRAIMRRLNMDIEVTNNADDDAKRILKNLKYQKYLLLLDDVKEELNLSELGIPLPNDKNGNKIVLTARLRHLFNCIDDGWDVSRIIEVKPLSKEESWKMFLYVLQCPEFIEDSDKGTLAFRLCNECGGNPLLIKTVAKTLKVKDNVRLWAGGLNSWRMWPEKGYQGMREFYMSLQKFCLEELDDDMKKCFFYGALYPEESDIYIDYLLECWAAENFFQIENQYISENAQYISGNAILHQLKTVALLEEGKSGEYVTMHKCYRQVALDISSNYPEFNHMVKTSAALREPPDVESWKQKNRISMVNNEFKKLPDSPNCNMLSTLFLQKNLGLKIIPASFFDHMESLRVLDFSHTGITSLPPSLSKLMNLKVLNLSECKYLVELASHIVELVHLEALDIRGSGVNGIPPHIENLHCLRHLQVSFTKSGNENDTEEVGFNHDMISKLSRLEALVVDVKSSEQCSNKVVEEIIKGVATLEKFRSLKFFYSNEVENVIEVVPPTLRIYVPEADILQTFIKENRSRNVQHKSFQFFIGCKNSKDRQIPKHYQYERYIKYCNAEGCNPSILEALVEADAFELVDHKDIKQLSDFAVGSMNKVRGCLVKSCKTIETIVGTVDSVVLQKLEQFYLVNLPKLKSISKGPLKREIFSKLNTLLLSSCPMLIKIFTHGVIQQLIEIQYLKIEDCSGIEEIIPEAEIVANLQVLPKLKKLILLNLPRLKRIYANDSLKWPSLEKLKIYKCPILHKLPFNKDNAKELNSIKAEKDWWEALQWQNKEIKEQLEESCVLRLCNDAAR